MNITFICYSYYLKPATFLNDMSNSYIVILSWFLVMRDDHYIIYCMLIFKPSYAGQIRFVDRLTNRNDCSLRNKNMIIGFQWKTVLHYLTVLFYNINSR
jgi:hypothetical protein